MRESLVMTSAYTRLPAHTDCRDLGGEERPPLGRVFFSLAANRMASVAFGKRAFLVGNDIDCHRLLCSIKARLAKLFALV